MKDRTEGWSMRGVDEVGMLPPRRDTYPGRLYVEVVVAVGPDAAVSTCVCACMCACGAACMLDDPRDSERCGAASPTLGTGASKLAVVRYRGSDVPSPADLPVVTGSTEADDASTADPEADALTPTLKLLPAWMLAAGCPPLSRFWLAARNDARLCLAAALSPPPPTPSLPPQNDIVPASLLLTVANGDARLVFLNPNAAVATADNRLRDAAKAPYAPPPPPPSRFRLSGDAFPVVVGGLYSMSTSAMLEYTPLPLDRMLLARWFALVPVPICSPTPRPKLIELLRPPLMLLWLWMEQDALWWITALSCGDGEAPREAARSGEPTLCVRSLPVDDEMHTRTRILAP